ncbi:MAG: hypothetical protein AAF405_09650 [Pseudomonadota bacterium]
MRLSNVMSACIVLIAAAALTGPALGQDAADACIDKLSKTESMVDETVNAKVLDEGDVEEVNILLDEADAACTDGDYKRAEAKLAKVMSMLKPAPAAATAAQ